MEDAGKKKPNTCNPAPPMRYPYRKRQMSTAKAIQQRPAITKMTQALSRSDAGILTQPFELS